MNAALQLKMDDMTRRQKMDLILMLIAHEGKRCDPDQFRAFVVGTLGNLANGMSDSSFKQFCAVHRCGEASCGCHVIAGEAAKFFKLLREDIKKELSRRSCQRN